MTIIYLKSEVYCLNHLQLVNDFLSTNLYQNLAIYKTPRKDEFFEELIEIAKKHEVHISTQPIANLTKLHDTLCIFQEPSIDEFINTYSLEEIQFELLKNTWLILSNITSNEIKDYFYGTKLRMGLNVKIFFALKSNGKNLLVQVLGTGNTNVEIVVSL